MQTFDKIYCATNSTDEYESLITTANWGRNRDGENDPLMPMVEAVDL